MVSHSHTTQQQLVSTALFVRQPNGSVASWSSRRGLTLVEMVVAIGLLATVVVAVTPWLRELRQASHGPLQTTVLYGELQAFPADDIRELLVAGGRLRFDDQHWLTVAPLTSPDDNQAGPVAQDSSGSLRVQLVECTLRTGEHPRAPVRARVVRMVVHPEPLTDETSDETVPATGSALMRPAAAGAGQVQP